MIVRTDNELKELLDDMLSSPLICLDVETVDRGYPDFDLTGIAMAGSNGKFGYVPTGHAEGTCLPREIVFEQMRKAMGGFDGKVIMHHAAYDMKVLDYDGGLRFREDKVIDTMVASWLLDTEGEHGLKSLAKRYLDMDMVELKDICKIEKHPKTKDDVYRTDLVPIATMAKYAIDDVKAPILLWEKFEPRIKEEGLEKVFYELEMPFVFILMEMEQKGTLLNQKKLNELFEEAPNELERIAGEIYALRPSKKSFKISSPVELGEVLFDEMKIPPIGVKGKSGRYSTKKEYLEKWAKDYPIAEKILEYRLYDKMLSTYLTGLSKRVWRDGRIRSSFRRTIKTGRISSSKPNLQNIPNHENDVYGLRSLFTVPEGRKMIVADYSQIELRVLAHLSRDPNFVEAYKKNEDVHSMTAKMLFDLNCPTSEVKDKHPDLRSIGKTFNFGNVYGAGVKTLAVQAKVSESKASDARDKYYRRFTGIRRYLDWIKSYAREKGYVKTLTGRKRHLPDAMLRARTQDENVRLSVAERQAGNTPIQGGAADIVMIAMRNIKSRLKKEGLLQKAQFLLQVHDEILLEAEDSVVDEVKAIVKEEMEGAVKLRVPLVADIGVGKIWSEAKE